jgi:hypothetical protein
MNVLDRIQVAASDTNSLDRFLSKNASDITDWLNKLPHGELLTLRTQFRNFILLKLKVWQRLPRSEVNLSFLALLLEKMEQLGDAGSFYRIFHEIQQTSYDPGSRLRAASLYLYDKVTNAEQLVALYGPIYQLLTTAVETEDDNPDKALGTLIQYYLFCINSFGQFNKGVPKEIKGLIEGTLIGDPDSFLHCALVDSVLVVSFGDYELALEAIRQLLDEYLGRARPVIGVETGILVESNTAYCRLIDNVATDFEEIRSISAQKHQANPNAKAAWSSLNRGTTIIDREEQLWAYMTAFGPMHSQKLLDAFDKVDFTSVTQPVTVIDWGAGQGFATMVLFDYLNKKNITLELQKVVLVEPSSLAVRRGGLHSLKFDQSISLDTINKPLDDLEPRDFQVVPGTVIHLFSNILDVDAVSLSKLRALIVTSFPGVNYFVCCSPHINSTKTQRLNTFMDSFEGPGLVRIYTVTHTAIQWNGKWTRAVRVFKSSL